MGLKSLSRRNVEDHRMFDRADDHSFSILLDFLRVKGFRVASATRELEKIMPWSYKSLWRPDSLEIGNLSGTPRVHGRVIVHHAMHALMSHRFGSSLKGRAKLALLAEGMAGALEFYFELKHLARGGGVDDLVDLKYVAEYGQHLKRDYVRRLNAMIDKPFAAFRRNAILSYEISVALMELSDQSGVEFKRNSNRLARRLSKNEDYVFIAHKDFSNFVLYARAYCGMKSSARDLRDTAQCLRLLKKARSMPELLSMLADPICFNDGTLCALEV